MKIPNGSTDRKIYFVAVDSTDLKTRETGLTTFTVYRSRNGGSGTAMSTPTIAELDSTNMSGVYSLLVDEDTTLGAGNDTEEMCFHITQASMAPVTRTIELYHPDHPVKNAAISGFTFLMVDSTDNVTGKTGLTVTAERSLDGAAFASCANSVSEISVGIYKIDLAAGDMNGSTVTLKFTATGADTRFITIVTQPT